MIMLTIKTALRHLFRNKFFTMLNIIGLTIGIGSCWILYTIISYELSYEKDFPHKEQTYRVLSRFLNDGEEKLFGGISKPIYFALKEDVTGHNRVVPVFRQWPNSVTIPETGQQIRKTEDLDPKQHIVVATETSYFDMLPYQWLAGNKQQALTEPHQVVLTEKRARQYFPQLKVEEIIGKTIIYDNTTQKTVSGIVTNLPFPSEFNGQEFVLLERKAYELYEWTNTNGGDRVYLQTKSKSDADHIIQQMQVIINDKWEQFRQQTRPDYTFDRSLYIMPLAESHFSTYMPEWLVDKTSKSVIYSLIGVGIFLLMLACINYINLITAQMPQRHKEIGIRKTLGSSQKILIFQILTETTIIVLLALALSAAFVPAGINLLDSLVKEEVKTFSTPFYFSLFIATTLLITILISGLYPAWLMTKVKPVDIFSNRGQIQISHGKFTIRRSLIVFQFVVAQIFIVGTLIVGQQLRYVVQKDMGFNKEAVIISELPGKLTASPNFHEKKLLLAENIRQIAGVKDVSMGTTPLSQGYSSSRYSYSPTEGADPVYVRVSKGYIDTSFIRFYDLKLLAGQNLRYSDTTNTFIINEAGMRAFGFTTPDDALGKIIGQDGQKYPVAGVVKDFHQLDFFHEITPLVLMSDKQALYIYNIKLDAEKRQHWPQTIAAIQEKWTTVFPETAFDYSFYDDKIAALYEKEQQLFKLTNISTAIAIFISCLGLFGLAKVISIQRNKEIGIRKVLGASVSAIVAMLTQDFVRMVLIATLIAAPIIWWAANKWLEDFIYRIEISGFPFLVGGLIAIVSSLLTVSFQTIKAAITNPVKSLRSE